MPSSSSVSSQLRALRWRSKAAMAFIPCTGDHAASFLVQALVTSDSGGQAGEVPRAAQFECLMEARLQVAVRGLDRAILVADAGVVAGWLHAVVAAELGIARGFSRSVGAASRETAGRVVAVAHRI